MQEKEFAALMKRYAVHNAKTHGCQTSEVAFKRVFAA
jgi:hypothetical protein